MNLRRHSRRPLLLPLTLLGLFACQEGLQQLLPDGAPLTDADAEWDPSPVPTPGGGGEPGTSGSDGSDGGYSTGGSGGSPTGGDGDGDGDGYGSDGGTTGGDWGDGDGDGDGDGTTGGDGDGDGEAFCAPAPEGTSCNAVPGVCETLMDMSTMLPCCDDPDCMCRGTECGQQACQADAVCDCGCPDGTDPDCGPDSCALTSAPLEAPATDRPEECPGADEPVVLYMSNDDSNSQASPMVARHLINSGYRVDSSVIRIHEFLNYYDLNHDLPTDAAVALDAQLRRVDAESDDFGLLLAVKGQRQLPEQRPPLNLVLSVDTSGSMSGVPMQNLKNVVAAVASQLREGDVVSVVSWSGSTDVILSGHYVTPGDSTLSDIAASLEAGGGTDLNGGLVRAYQLANDHRILNGINRVIIISDGGANLGVTSADLIGQNAANADADGILLVGVGVSDAGYYSDTLMDEMTDAGKGAYVYVDTAEEAAAQFADPDRFLSNLSIVARNVQVEVTLPWYFGIKKFSGEEYADTPEEVEPQHLAPNDTMNFHQIIESCAPGLAAQTDEVTVRASYVDPLDNSAQEVSRTFDMQELINRPADQLYKADVVVSYAEALIQIDDRLDAGDTDTARAFAMNMAAWLDAAAQSLEDDEVAEMAALMQTYVASI